MTDLLERLRDEVDLVTAGSRRMTDLLERLRMK